MNERRRKNVQKKKSLNRLWFIASAGLKLISGVTDSTNMYDRKHTLHTTHLPSGGAEFHICPKTKQFKWQRETQMMQKEKTEKEKKRSDFIYYENKFIKQMNKTKR